MTTTNKNRLTKGLAQRALAAVIALVLAFSAAPATALAGTVDVSGTGDTVSGREALTLCNNIRAQYGVGALAWDRGLEALAMHRAAELSVSFAHVRPSGQSWETVLGSGWYHAAAENLASGQQSAAQASAELAASPAHLANMVNAAYTSYACAMFKDAAGQTYWIEIFADGACPVTPQVEYYNGPVVASVEV